MFFWVGGSFSRPTPGQFNGDGIPDVLIQPSSAGVRKVRRYTQRNTFMANSLMRICFHDYGVNELLPYSYTTMMISAQLSGKNSPR